MSDTPVAWKPTPKQSEFLSAPEEEVLYGGAAGGGKALDIDTPIPTPIGWARMGDLQPGDTVFDETGAPCQVLAVSEIMHDRPCYAVKFSDGSEIVADEGHLWTTFNDRNKPRTVTTKEILATLEIGTKGRKAHKIPVARALQLPHTELPIDPYLLGAWLGDGKTVAGSFTSADPEIIEAFASQYPTNKQSGKYAYGTVGLCSQLRALGVLGDKHIPLSYLRASKEHRIALLQGLMDTDGYCDPRGQCEIILTNQRLIEGVLELILSLGIKAAIGEGLAKLNGRVIGPKYRIKFITDIQAFRLPRKLSRQKRDGFRGTHDKRYIVAVTPVKTRPVKCIKVSSKSHLYLAGREMTPTHNSDALIIDALGAGQNAFKNSRYTALIIKRSFAQLEDLCRRTRIIYPIIDPKATFNEQKKTWTFDSGARVVFGYCERDNDVYQYQGSEYQWIGIDELGQYPSPFVLEYLSSRLRSPDRSLNCYLRATCNPGPKWIMERYGIKKQGGSSQVAIQVGERTIVRRFIASSLADNPHLEGTGYRERLQLLGEAEREQLLNGRWDVYDVPGAVYKDEVSRYREHVRPVPHDPELPVHTVWDLGFADNTSIAMVQKGPDGVIRVIDYIQDRRKPLNFYVQELNSKTYNYGTDFLPHDANSKNFLTGKSTAETARAMGRAVEVLPREGVDEGIRAARLVFPKTYFDEVKTEKLMDCLRNYKYGYNNATGAFTTPVHDEYSHGADVFRYLAMCEAQMHNSSWSTGRLTYPKLHSA